MDERKQKKKSCRRGKVNLKYCSNSGEYWTLLMLLLPLYVLIKEKKYSLSIEMHVNGDDKTELHRSQIRNLIAFDHLGIDYCIPVFMETFNFYYGVLTVVWSWNFHFMHCTLCKWTEFYCMLQSIWLIESIHIRNNAQNGELFPFFSSRVYLRRFRDSGQEWNLISIQLLCTICAMPRT